MPPHVLPITLYFLAHSALKLGLPISHIELKHHLIQRNVQV